MYDVHLLVMIATLYRQTIGREAKAVGLRRPCSYGRSGPCLW